ncbi:MAG: MOSC domain-containing protein [Pseudomonadota bacterium]
MSGGSLESIATLTRRVARPGRIAWIGLRPGRRAEMRPVPRVYLGPSALEGDHAGGSKRALTLIQSEHLPVIAALAGVVEVTPDMLRRNLVISGINLLALRHRDLQIGTALIRVTGPCAPCSRMEETLGPGGYSAVRGHGGLCASVLESGEIAIGDAVTSIGGQIGGEMATTIG